MIFDATDQRGIPIYHTNVMMCIATDFAMVGTELITDPHQRHTVERQLGTTNRPIITLSRAQIREFAGNAIELQGVRGRILALSRRAHETLDPDQIAIIEQSCAILPLDVPTIELAGGSIRCMLGGIHLETRPTTPTHPAQPTAAHTRV